MRTLRTRSLSWATQLVVPARPPPLGRRGPHPRPNLQVSILLSSRPPRLVSPSWVAGEGTKSLRAPSAREGGCHLPCVELGIGNGGKRRPCPSVRPGVRPSVSSSSLLELVSRSVRHHGHNLLCPVGGPSLLQTPLLPAAEPGSLGMLEAQILCSV